MSETAAASKEQVEAAKLALDAALMASWGHYEFPYAPIEIILSALAIAEADTARLAILNAAIMDDRLVVDNNALPPIEAYPPDSTSDLDRYVVYDLTDAADELLAHAAKLAADPAWRQTRK
jgi:hypothetical protein